MNARTNCLLIGFAFCLPILAHAQDGQSAGKPRADSPPSAAPESRDAPPERAFKPSQEVSPDQEVDFPADI